MVKSSVRKNFVTKDLPGSALIDQGHTLRRGFPSAMLSYAGQPKKHGPLLPHGEDVLGINLLVCAVNPNKRSLMEVVAYFQNLHGQKDKYVCDIQCVLHTSYFYSGTFGK